MLSAAKHLLFIYKDSSLLQLLTSLDANEKHGKHFRAKGYPYLYRLYGKLSHFVYCEKNQPMENIIDKLEFGNVKQLRKNLMIVSATGIIISQLVKYSKGDVSFFGFTKPDHNLPLLNKLIWWIVLYFFVALIVRYFDDEFQKFYKRKMKGIEIMHTMSFKAGDPQMDIDMAKFHIKVEVWDMLRKVLVSFLDLIVPLGLGKIALFMTWEF